MTRKHRSVHRLLWPALALTIGIALAAALYLRPPAAETQQIESKR
jgi:hypothetical protein